MDSWVAVSERLPKDRFDIFYVGYLTQEHMWTTRRLSPYDVVSGGYLNRFPRLYTHWMILSVPSKESE